MYKNGSSSWGLSSSEEAFVDKVALELIMFDDVVAGEEGSEESLTKEEPMDETLMWLNEDIDPELIEAGDAGCGSEPGSEEAPRLGVGWMVHWENSSGTARPCA